MTQEDHLDVSHQPSNSVCHQVNDDSLTKSNSKNITTTNGNQKFLNDCMSSIARSNMGAAIVTESRENDLELEGSTVSTPSSPDQLSPLPLLSIENDKNQDQSIEDNITVRNVVADDSISIERAAEEHSSTLTKAVGTNCDKENSAKMTVIKPQNNSENIREILQMKIENSDKNTDTNNNNNADENHKLENTNNSDCGSKLKEVENTIVTQEVKKENLENNESESTIVEKESEKSSEINEDDKIEKSIEKIEENVKSVENSESVSADIKKSKRRSKERSISQDIDDPIARLNALKANISNALKEVKAVLIEHGEPVLPEKPEKRETSEKDNDNPEPGVVNFRFVKKIRRRSTFEEDKNAITEIVVNQIVEDTEKPEELKSKEIVTGSKDENQATTDGKGEVKLIEEAIMKKDENLQAKIESKIILPENETKIENKNQTIATIVSEDIANSEQTKQEQKVARDIQLAKPENKIDPPKDETVTAKDNQNVSTTTSEAKAESEQAQKLAKEIKLTKPENKSDPPKDETVNAKDNQKVSTTTSEAKADSEQEQKVAKDIQLTKPENKSDPPKDEIVNTKDNQNVSTTTLEAKADSEQEQKVANDIQLTKPENKSDPPKDETVTAKDNQNVSTTASQNKADSEQAEQTQKVTKKLSPKTKKIKNGEASTKSDDKKPTKTKKLMKKNSLDDTSKITPSAAKSQESQENKVDSNQKDSTTEESSTKKKTVKAVPGTKKIVKTVVSSALDKVLATTNLKIPNDRRSSVATAKISDQPSKPDLIEKRRSSTSRLVLKNKQAATNEPEKAQKNPTDSKKLEGTSQAKAVERTASEVLSSENQTKTETPSEKMNTEKKAETTSTPAPRNSLPSITDTEKENVAPSTVTQSDKMQQLPTAPVVSSVATNKPEEKSLPNKSEIVSANVNQTVNKNLTSTEMKTDLANKTIDEKEKASITKVVESSENVKIPAVKEVDHSKEQVTQAPIQKETPSQKTENLPPSKNPNEGQIELSKQHPSSLTISTVQQSHGTPAPTDSAKKSETLPTKVQPASQTTPSLSSPSDNSVKTNEKKPLRAAPSSQETVKTSEQKASTLTASSQQTVKTSEQKPSTLTASSQQTVKTSEQKASILTASSQQTVKTSEQQKASTLTASSKQNVKSNEQNASTLTASPHDTKNVSEKKSSIVTASSQETVKTNEQILSTSSGSSQQIVKQSEKVAPTSTTPAGESVKPSEKTGESTTSTSNSTEENQENSKFPVVRNAITAKLAELKRTPFKMPVVTKPNLETAKIHPLLVLHITPPKNPSVTTVKKTPQQATVSTTEERKKTSPKTKKGAENGDDQGGNSDQEETVGEKEKPTSNGKKRKSKKVVIRRLKRKLSLDTEEKIPETEIEEKEIQPKVPETASIEPEKILGKKSCLKVRAYEPGEFVLYADRIKKQIKWKKAKVVDKITSISYTLDIEGEEKPAHISYIKKYTDKKVHFGGKEYLEIDYAEDEDDDDEEEPERYNIWARV